MMVCECATPCATFPLLLIKPCEPLQSLLSVPSLVAKLAGESLPRCASLSFRGRAEQSRTLERDVSFLSRISYWWLNKLVSTGRRRTLQRSDLCCHGDDNSARTLCSALEQRWRPGGRGQEDCEQENNRETEREGASLSGERHAPVGPSLLRYLCLWLRPSLIPLILLRMTSDLLALLPPLALRCVILYCENQPVFDWSRHTYALALLAAVVCHALVQQASERHSRMTEVEVQTALKGAVYKQALFRSSPAVVLNSFLGDTCRVAELPAALPAVWSSGLQGALCVFLLWRELGPSALAGLGLLMLLVPLTSVVERRARDIQRALERARGEREHILQEMLSGIKTVKMLVLEVWFQHRVGVARQKELEILRILGYLTAFSLLDHVCVPFLVYLSCFGVYVLVDDGNVLTASQVFTCVCLLTMLRSPMKRLPSLSLRLTQAWHSLLRLDHFLLSVKPLHTDNGALSGNGVKKNCVPEELSERCSKDMLSVRKVNTEHLSSRGVSSSGCVRQYLCACGWGWVTLTVLAQVCVCAVCVCQAGLLAQWTREAKELQGLEEWRELRTSRLSVYAVLGLLQAISVCCVAFAVTRGSLRASCRLHSELLSSKLRLPLSFFQTTPTSQVLHSLTQSMYVIDELVPAHLHTWLTCWLQVCATVLLIGYNSLLFSLAVPPLSILLLTLQSYYRAASGQVRRMVADASSSLSLLLREGHRDEVINTQDRVDALNLFYDALDEHLMCRYNSILLDRWIAVRLDMFAGALLLLVSLALMGSDLDPSAVGLSLTYALSVREVLHLLVQTSCDVESSAGVLQRMDKHTHEQREPPGTLPCTVPPSWPEEGVLEFSNYKPEINPSSTGLSFCTQPREKVGVVSRSGADLDAIVSSLFRLVEGRGGVVMVDGVDVACVGLHDLRSRLAVIPQAPVLFAGSLRSNLDPWGCHSDAQVWQVLERCHLKETVSVLPGQLLHPLGYGGAGLSSSERRLLCVSRALLKSSVLLVYEDPLPPVDPDTDRLIRNILHTEFSHGTVLTLTRNPWNITQTDRVLVLEGGCVAEFDTPSVLLLKGELYSQLLSEGQRDSSTEEEE